MSQTGYIYTCIHKKSTTKIRLFLKNASDVQEPHDLATSFRLLFEKESNSCGALLAKRHEILNLVGLIYAYVCGHTMRAI